MSSAGMPTRQKTPADYLGTSDPSTYVAAADAQASAIVPEPSADDWKKAALAAGAPEISGAGVKRLNDIIAQERKIIDTPPPAAPDQPKVPDMVQQPDYKPKDIGRAMMNPVLIAAFALASLASKDHLNGMAQAVSGYIKGFKQADKDAMEQQRQNWLDKNEQVQKDFALRSEAYRNALEANANNVALQSAKFTELANEFGDQKAALAGQHRNAGVMWEYLNKMDEIHGRLAEQYFRVMQLGYQKKTPQESMLDEWDKINPKPADPKKQADWYNKRAAAYKDIEVNSRLTPTNMGLSGSTQYNPIIVTSQADIKNASSGDYLQLPDGRIMQK